MNATPRSLSGEIKLFNKEHYTYIFTLYGSKSILVSNAISLRVIIEW